MNKTPNQSKIIINPSIGIPRETIEAVGGTLLQQPESSSWNIVLDPISVDSVRAAGGTVHELPHVEPVVMVPGDIDARFEAMAGETLIRDGEHLPRLSADRTLRAANLLVEPLRETYRAYLEDGTPAGDRSEALVSFQRRLDPLPYLNREYYLALVAYAVHTEMKFRANPAYILAPDHEFELLIDAADYETDEDLLEAGVRENIERLVAIADTAAAYAVSDSQSAKLDAGRAAKAS